VGDQSVSGNDPLTWTLAGWFGKAGSLKPLATIRTAENGGVDVLTAAHPVVARALQELAQYLNDVADQIIAADVVVFPGDHADR
jgi:hypothetical protein